MITRTCPRTIDRPLLVLGLEGEDIALLMVVFGVPAIVFSPAVPVLALFAAWPSLVAFKKGKPEGYVIHWLYRQGVPFKGLLPPGDTCYAIYSRENNDAI